MFKEFRLKRLGLLVVLFVVGACSDQSNSGAQAPEQSEGASGDVAAAAPPAEHPGKDIYGQFCFSCHGPGLSGAPKFGDVEAWAPRIAKGRALLLQTTIEGIPPAMPPRGVCMSCTDEELDQAIDYMIVNAQ